MAIKNRKPYFVILMLAAALYLPPALFGCGGGEDIIFTYSKHPDLPLEKFAGGELGVLQPTYARSYLYVAYRYLIGAGFNEQEQKAIVALWNERLGLNPSDSSESNESSSNQEGAEYWPEVRNKVPGAGPPPKIEFVKFYGETHIEYLNCPEDAFRTAARTLNKRIEEFGPASPQVIDWVEAQDQVFANCSEGQTIPAPPKPGTDPIIRADRAYQIAAAYFYSGNFDMSKKLFEEIARDASSPWRQIAPYLVARSLLRKAVLVQANQPDMATLAQAEAQLKKVLSDRSLSTIHPAGKRLLNLVEIRLHPKERLHELGQDLLKKDSEQNLEQDLWDYTVLLDKFREEEESEKRTEKFSNIGEGDDLTDWVITFESTDKEALEHSLQRWEKSSSLPWLVASLSKINGGHPKLPELLRASEKVKQNSPAFLTVRFHRIRLLMESGRKKEAREELNSLFSKGGPSLSHSLLNLFLGERMMLAQDLDEFLKYALRTPAAISFGFRELPEDIGDDEQLKAALECIRFDGDSAKILNEKMPLSRLEQAATSKVLPIHLRKRVALAAWVRSVLLENETTGKEMVPILASLLPELKEYLNTYASAENSEARKFAGIFAILKFEDMNPYVGATECSEATLDKGDHHGGWWCSPLGYTLEKEAPAPDEVPTTLIQKGAPDFLDEAEKAAAKDEAKKLSSIGNAPNYLCRQVLERAKKNPDDPRIPEALHLAVRSTHYGCTDDNTTKLSKAAFQLLHKQYPSSIWAKKTKYWY